MVVGAAVSLQPGDDPSIQERMEGARVAPSHQSRSRTAVRLQDPEGAHAAGLIEAAGAKGLRIGGARGLDKHANFIVTDPGTSSADVWTLVERVRDLVASRSGIRLETEVQVLGRWPMRSGERRHGARAWALAGIARWSSSGGRRRRDVHVPVRGDRCSGRRSGRIAREDVLRTAGVAQGANVFHLDAGDRATARTGSSDPRRDRAHPSGHDRDPDRPREPVAILERSAPSSALTAS